MGRGQQSFSPAFPRARRTRVSHDKPSRSGREHILGASYQERACQGPGWTVRHDGSAEEGAGRGRESRAGYNSRAGAMWTPGRSLGRAGVSGGGRAPRGALPRKERRSGSPARSPLSGAPDRQGKPTCRESPGQARGQAQRARASLHKGLLGIAGCCGRRLCRAKSSPDPQGIAAHACPEAQSGGPSPPTERT